MAKFIMDDKLDKEMTIKLIKDTEGYKHFYGALQKAVSNLADAHLWYVIDFDDPCKRRDIAIKIYKCNKNVNRAKKEFWEFWSFMYWFVRKRI